MAAPFIIRITGSQKWESFTYFDGNKYPEFLRDTADACGDRLALMLYYAEILPPQLEEDISRFVTELNKNVAGIDFSKNGFPNGVATYHSITHLASLHGMLTSFKSLLDVLSVLWVRMIDSKCTMNTFSKKKLGDDLISGGRLINWLRASVPASNQIAQDLSDILEDQSRAWITQAVNWRDDVVHHGGIRGIEDLRLEFASEGASEFGKSDVLLPTMPTGESVVEYCQGLTTNAQRLIRQVLELFEIDSK